MRRLAIACVAFSAGIFLPCYIDAPAVYTISAGLCIIVFLVLRLLQVLPGKWQESIEIVLLALSLGLSYFSAYYIHMEEKIQSIRQEKTEHVAVALDYPEQISDTWRITVEVRDPNNRYRAYLYDRYGSIKKLVPGNVFSTETAFVCREKEDNASYDSLTSKSILAYGSVRSEIRILRKGATFLFPAKGLNHLIREKIPALFDERTSAFLKALLLGEKKELYSDDGVYSTLLRAGFMHTVAVSGMHVSYVAGLSLALFGSKKRGSFLSICMIWLFVFSAGNTPSALRAGIMQSVLLLAPVFRRENDSMTSLPLAMALILAVNPFAAKSVSLQLSFGATCGIIMFSSRINRRILSGVTSATLHDLLRYPTSMLSSSLGVSAITVPLCAIHFGYISLFSFLANLAALWAVPICFCGALLSVFVSFLSAPAAIMLSRIVSLFCGYILKVCGLVAKIPYALVPFDNCYILVLTICIYCVFVIFALTKIEGLGKISWPVCLSSVMLTAYFLFFRFSAALSAGEVSVLDVGQGECIAAFSGNRSVVIDCGSSDYMVHAGETCAEYLYVHGQTNLDSLVLTHLHEDHVNGACSLMQTIPVKNLFVSVDADLESEIFLKIRSYAERNGTKIYLVDADYTVASGKMKYTFFPSYVPSDTNDSCMSVLLDIADKRILITGDSPYYLEEKLTDRIHADRIDVLIAGHHGANNASSSSFLREVDPQYAAISVGKYNDYGHPSVFALRRMDLEKITVLRTDLNGNISFIIHD